MRLLCLSAVAAVVLFVATTSKHGAAATIPNAQKSANELLAADRGFAAFATTNESIDGLSPMFSADIIMPVRGKGFAKGKAAVIGALKANPGTSNARVEWAPIGVGVSADGNQGFTYGFMMEHQQGDKQSLLKYLAYWRRDEAGWRVIAYKRGGRAQGSIESVPQSALQPGLLAAATHVSKSGFGKSLATAERAFSDAAQKIGLSAAFAEFGSVDSMNLGGDGNPGFVFGAEAISKLVGAGEPQHGSSVSWAADERVVVADSGDLGLSVGYIHFNQRADDGSERPPIPFFTVWRRAALDQPWRYIAE